MPPIVALILTSSFVLFLLHLDRKQNPSASLALWIPTLWILLVFSVPLGHWFGIGGMSIEEGSLFDRVFISMLLIISLLILAKRHFIWANGFKDNKSLMLLVGYMLIAILWSDMPFVSFKRWVREGFTPIVMAFVVATEADCRAAMMSIFRRIIYIHIPFSFLLLKYYLNKGVVWHRWTGEVTWVGVTANKNELAVLCLISIFFLVWTLIRRWRGRDIRVTRYQTYIELFLILISLWLFTGPHHTFTYSSTSTACLAAGLTILIMLLWLKRRNIIPGANTLTVFICLVIIYGTLTPFMGGMKILDVSSLLGRDETLTGRTDIWAFLTPYVNQKPFLGHGYGGTFWTEDIKEMIHMVGSSHNGYLETLLNLGGIGLIFFSIFFFSTCRKARKLMDQDFYWGAFWFCFITMVLMHNITESTMNKFTSISRIIIFLQVVLPSKDLMLKNASRFVSDKALNI